MELGWPGRGAGTVAGLPLAPRCVSQRQVLRWRSQGSRNAWQLSWHSRRKLWFGSCGLFSTGILAVMAQGEETNERSFHPARCQGHT